MKVLVRHMLKKTRSGGYAQRDEIIEAPSIRFGRGADCEIHLADPRILLHHAEMTERPGGLFLESLGSIDFQANERLTSAASLKPGDSVHLGPYDLVILEAQDGVDAAFSLEYARPLGDDLAALKERSNTETARVGLGIRGWAWLMFLIAVGIGIAAPVASHFSKTGGVDPMTSETRGDGMKALLAKADEIWLSGPVSGVHAHFGDQCETCHVNAFEQVDNTVCTACHDDAGHHADATLFPVASLDGQRCGSCHKEHTDGNDLTISGESFCTDCHSELSTVAASSRLKDVGGFESHPEFHPTVVKSHAPMTFERLEIGSQPGPVDRSNLKFPHAKHLQEKGMRSPEGEGRVQLTCGDCHRPETGGVAMLPVRFETACASCHRLQFEPSAPERVMPHGDVAAAKLFVEDTYAALALRGGYKAEETDAPAVVRRIVGSEMTEDERQEALQWADSKASEVLDGRYGRGLCGQCHEIDKGDGLRDWTVAPVHLTTRWLPKGYFTHKAHEDRSCTTCHAAPESDSSRDVLLPSIAVCQDCHGGEFASGKTRTACTDCHGFHREDMMPDQPSTSASLNWE